MDLGALLQVLWRKKWILIIVPMFAAGSALLVRMLGEWKYKSSAQLTTGLTVSDELVGNAKGLNPYEVQVTFNNLIETIKSRSVLGQLSYRLLLHDLSDSTTAFRTPNMRQMREKYGNNIAESYPTFTHILKNHVDSITLLNPNQPEEKLILNMIDTYEYDFESILKELLIYRLNQSDFIEISYSSEHAQLSAFVVNTVCSEFIRYYTSVKDSRSNVSLESLAVITQQRKDYLDEKSAELQLFKSNTDIINSEVESETRMRQIQSYEEQIASADQKISALALTLANIKTRIANADQASTTSQNLQIIGLRKRIDAINSEYITGGQSNAALLDSLKSLRTKLDETLRAGREATKVTPEELAALRIRKEEVSIELEIGRENLTSLNKIYGSLKYKLGDFANKEAIGVSLEKEVEVARQEYLASQNRLAEARDKTLTNKLSISQILMAEPAEKVESRKTLMFMIFSGLISFVISAFVIIALELMDSRIRTRQRFKQMTRLRLAGALPKMDVAKVNWETIFNSGEKQSMINEEVRKIRFEIDNQKPRVLLVSSIREGQGKSFFIIALAYSFSLLKKRVLIIDTNLRNNSLTRLFVVGHGLKLILENFASRAKLLNAAPGGQAGNGNGKGQEETAAFDDTLISRTQNSLIDIIGNKKSQLSPSEVIPKGDFKVLLEWLKNQYDYIILEGPSLDKFSDTKELVGFVDLVIPVFAADSIINGQDNESLNYLKALQGKLGPAVLNKVEPNA